MGSLSRPVFAWLINRLGSRSSEFKTTLVCLLDCFCWNKYLRFSTADKLQQTSFILPGALLVNQLMY